MYCLKCGTQNPDDSKFCLKCGYPIGTDPTDKDHIVNVEKYNQRQKMKKIYLACAGVAALIAIVIVLNVVRNNHNSGRSGSKSNSGAEDYESFSLDAISEQCEGCTTPLNTYIELINSAKSLNGTKEGIDEYSMEKYYEMQHNCSAEVIEVEDIPYAYHGSYGTYTGEWKGAGPTGYGSYHGFVYKTDAVSYTGEWAYGLPNGEGELYIENFYAGWNMTYRGQMANGKRNGVGYLYEYLPNEYYNWYRIYDKTTFQNDIMSEVTQCAEYDAQTGELLGYYRMIGDEKSGWVNSVAQWGANELSPEERQMLNAAESALVLGVVTYIVKGSIDASAEAHDYYYEKANNDMFADLNSYNANKAAQEQAELARQQEEEASQKHFYQYQYEKLHKQDPSDWSLDAQFYKYNM